MNWNRRKMNGARMSQSAAPTSIFKTTPQFSNHGERKLNCQETTCICGFCKMHLSSISINRLTIFLSIKQSTKMELLQVKIHTLERFRKMEKTKIQIKYLQKEDLTPQKFHEDMYDWCTWRWRNLISDRENLVTKVYMWQKNLHTYAHQLCVLLNIIRVCDLNKQDRRLTTRRLAEIKSSNQMLWK